MFECPFAGYTHKNVCMISSHVYLTIIHNVRMHFGRNWCSFLTQNTHIHTHSYRFLTLCHISWESLNSWQMATKQISQQVISRLYQYSSSFSYSLDFGFEVYLTFYFSTWIVVFDSICSAWKVGFNIDNWSKYNEQKILM